MIEKQLIAHFNYTRYITRSVFFYTHRFTYLKRGILYFRQIKRACNADMFRGLNATREMAGKRGKRRTNKHGDRFERSPASRCDVT